MKPIDIRNDNWESIQDRLDADRKAVWESYKTYGPCSTRELSEKISISIFSVRPRTTELLDMFLVELTGRNKDGGIYAHVPAYIARARYLAKQAELNQNGDQLDLFAA